ncbi:MAG: FecR domain-containing protein [Deltaproteobacteria bacterium]|nr:FecR domain-containing protein [Deltaproteobacteria bacterium]
MHPDLRMIARYLEGELGERATAALRRHLRLCERCRTRHDEEILRRRALTGDPESATAEDDRRMARLALAAVRREEPSSASLVALEPVPLTDPLVLLPRRAFLGGGAALALAASLLLVWGLRAPAPIVAMMKAGSHLSVNGEAVDRTRPLALRAGDRLETAGKGAGELELRAGGASGSLRIYPGTTLVLTDASEVQLERGRVWSRVEPGPAGFKVKTPEGEARVVGTSFVVEHEEESGTEVRVMKGVVDVHAKGKAVKVQALERTRIARGAAPEPPTRYDPRSDRMDWSRIWQSIVDGFNELLQSVQELMR